jgi:hypothetical protein
MATSPQEVDLVPGDEHTVSEHSKTPGIGGATTSSDTAISDIAISDTTISDTVISDIVISDTTISGIAISDTAISGIAVSDTAIVDPVVTALAERQQMRGLHRFTFQALARLENGNFLSLRQGANGYCLVARKIHNNTERSHIHRSRILLAVPSPSLLLLYTTRLLRRHSMVVSGQRQQYDSLRPRSFRKRCLSSFPRLYDGSAVSSHMLGPPSPGLVPEAEGPPIPPGFRPCCV